MLQSVDRSARALTWLCSCMYLQISLFTIKINFRNNDIDIWNVHMAVYIWKKQNILGYTLNYIPPVLVPSFAKGIATQMFVTEKLNERRDFVLRGFVCDIIRPSKKLPVQC